MLMSAEIFFVQRITVCFEVLSSKRNEPIVAASLSGPFYVEQ